MIERQGSAALLFPERALWFSHQLLKDETRLRLIAAAFGVLLWLAGRALRYILFRVG